MNENIDLTKILKNCPKGTKLYTPIWGEISFRKLLEDKIYVISIDTCSGNFCLTKEGCYLPINDAECIIFPSKNQRDWSKFTAPWYKKERFNPMTLKPFDKVLGRDFVDRVWQCDLFSHITESENYPYKCVGNSYRYCIPYNDETKHFVGTNEDAPEYYRQQED